MATSEVRRCAGPAAFAMGSVAVLLFLLVVAPSNDAQRLFNDYCLYQNVSRYYNLTSLRGDYFIDNVGTEFFTQINPCKSLTGPEVDPCRSAQVCQLSSKDPVRYYASCGRRVPWESFYDYRSHDSRLCSVTTRPITVEYDDGSPCATNFRSSIVIYECDQTEYGPVYVKEEPTCVYHYTWRGPSGCQAGCIAFKNTWSARYYDEEQNGLLVNEVVEFDEDYISGSTRYIFNLTKTSVDGCTEPLRQYGTFWQDLYTNQLEMLPLICRNSSSCLQCPEHQPLTGRLLFDADCTHFNVTFSGTSTPRQYFLVDPSASQP